MILILGIIILSTLFYVYILKPHKYWQNKGIQYDKPTMFFGSMLDFMLQRMPLFMKIDTIYKESEGKRDPELTKTICIKEFDSFPDHDTVTEVDIDPLWSKNLFSSTGDQWHSMRSVLSPSFTSSKMKMMFNLISNCTEDVIKHFFEQNSELITLEMKDTFSRMSNDIIATCAIGVKCNSIKVRDNDVYKHALDITDFKGIKSLKFLGYSISPKIMKYFGIKIFPTSSGNFFSKLINDTLKLRAEQNIVRPDMIHLMLKAREGLEQDGLQPSIDENKENSGKIKKNFQITDEDMVAQALLFLLGGLETVSNLLSFLAFELATNKNIQDKLTKEIKTTLKNCDNNLSYEDLMGMKYLDMVVSEGLRKWPTMPLLNRLCTKNYEIPADSVHDKPLTIEKGIAVWYSTYSLHMDTQYYAEPKRFDPERFSDENKGKIIPNTYLPFGVGPRNCMGSRFSLLQTKTVLVNILREFEFVPVKNTTISAKANNKDVMLSPGCEIWLGLQKRV